MFHGINDLSFLVQRTVIKQISQKNNTAKYFYGI